MSLRHSPLFARKPIETLLNFQLDPRFLKTPYDFANGHWFANMVTLPSGETCQAWFNLPAVFITIVITAILVFGVKESAGFNASMVMLNIGVILAIVGIG